MGYIEETDNLELDFKKIASMNGQEVIPVAVQNADTDEVILVAYTNELAMKESIRLKKLVLWSTSRNELWHKGATSGNEFELIEIYVNCEQNSLVYKVRPLGDNICHTSFNGVANNCYYRRLDMEQMKLVDVNKNQKIAVVGIGGVGGYMAGLLADTYDNVTFVARGARKQTIEKDGLVLHSEYRGERKVRPYKIVENISELEPQDYIFICVKNYSLENVCEELKGCITRDTVIIPVMNGVDPGERVRKFITKGEVIDSLIYIVAFIGEDGSIVQQGNFANVRIGINNADFVQKAKVRAAAQLLERAGIDCITADDIEKEIWKKYMLNAAYNVLTSFYDNTIGQIRSDSVKAKQYETLVNEAYAVAKAKGVHVCQEDADHIIYNFYNELQDSATSSLQRDINAGRQTEIETFCGYLVREGEKLEVPVPLTNQMYTGLKKKIENGSNI